jgi:hypothetical protein
MDLRRLGIVAVALGLLTGTAGAVAQDADSTIDYHSWRTKEVEPGVLRILDDGAGHDLTLKWPRNRGGLNLIAVGPDDEVWISATVVGGERNRSNDRRLWPLGQELTYGPADGLGRYHSALVFDDEGRLWVFGDRIATLDDGEWSSTRARNSVETSDGSVWLGGGMGVERWDGTELVTYLEDTWTGGVYLGPDDTVGVDGWDGTRLFDGTEWQLVSRPRTWRAVSEDGVLAVADGDRKGLRLYGNDRTAAVLEGVRVNSIAAAPDGSLWVAGSVGRNRGAAYRIDPGAVLAAQETADEAAGMEPAEDATST